MAMEKFMENVKKYSKFIGFGALVLILISILFIPFLVEKTSIFGYVLSKKSICLIELWQGKVALVFALIIAVSMILKKNKFVSIPAILTFVFTILGFTSKDNSKSFGTEFSCTWGFYLILIGVIAMLFYIYLDMKESKKSFKEYFDFKDEISFIKEKISKKEQPKKEEAK